MRFGTLITRWLGMALGTVLLLSACERESSLNEDEDAGPSPNVKQLPAPLATQTRDAGPGPIDAGGPEGIPADEEGRLILPEAGLPPAVPFATGRALSPDPPPIVDETGVVFQATWRWRDVPGSLDVAERNEPGLLAARSATAFRWEVQLAQRGRLRAGFASDAMPLPRGSEVRARIDRAGHLVHWPNRSGYRVIPPGALRTVLGERRVDASPLVAATVSDPADGERLGEKTSTRTWTTSFGTLRLESAEVQEAGAGGVLWCRLLLELIGAKPDEEACAPGEVPLFALYNWDGGGSIEVEVTELVRRNGDLPYRDLLVPPNGVPYQDAGLPTAPAGIFLTRKDLEGFRSAPAPVDPPMKDAPPEGIVAQNDTEVVVYLLLEGIPVAAIPPLSERLIVGPQPGTYRVQFRSFLSDDVKPATEMAVPLRVIHGAPPKPPVGTGTPDAGVP